MKRGIFVTGTDTGVGKTLACCALIHALTARGVRAVPMKPIAAGAVERGGRWINEDTALLLEAAGRDLSEAQACTPVLPRGHGAAARRAPGAGAAARGRFRIAGGRGDSSWSRAWIPRAERRHALAQFARPMALPWCSWWACAGCLNHALLTARATHACRRWIANSIDPNSGPDENARSACRARGSMRVASLPGADSRALPHLT
jgi:dethiobiotin synthetase